jgi:hypothetical protein
MGRFVLVCPGGAMAETSEAQEAAMAAWGAWFGTLGAAVVDGGAPFGASAAVSGGGAQTGLTGHSILEAADLEAAVGLAGRCPSVADGGRVDVDEAIDVTAG